MGASAYSLAPDHLMDAPHRLRSGVRVGMVGSAAFTRPGVAAAPRPPNWEAANARSPGAPFCLNPVSLLTAGGELQ